MMGFQEYRINVSRWGIHVFDTEVSIHKIKPVLRIIKNFATEEEGFKVDVAKVYKYEEPLKEEEINELLG